MVVLKLYSAFYLSIYPNHAVILVSMIKRIENNLREFVYGGMDGAVTTFAIVTGAAGANFSAKVILILGLANVFADAFSMAVGAYLSDKADQELEAKNSDEAKEYESPIEASIATFISFVLVGFVPLSVYIVDYIFSLGLSDSNAALNYSITLTLIAFAGIGYLRAVVTHIDKIKSTLETLGLGLAAAIISFGLGSVLEGVIT
ncbi:TPA: hypothetical protein EYO12_02990 [Candidatus Saccharibacteria bacterium]|nr:hypothetical protein [Candidatus Saccharibacteria bacterium]HIO87999.1 hypothetical protein [Candidatus Saccharibacteria bacterium]